MNRLPIILTLSRAVSIPIVVALALLNAPPWTFVVCLVWAVVSDIADGVLARRLGIDTPALRQLDTTTDTFFYLAVLFAIWMLHRDVVLAHASGLIAIVSLELLGFIVSKLKFGRAACHHAWSAKAFGLALFVASTCLLGFDISGWVFVTAIVVGIVCEVESLLMTLTLHRWQRDTPHLIAALRIARQRR